MMNCKAQGHTFWVVITMVVALIVLVILVVIFSSGSSRSNQGFFDCASKGGTCVGQGQDCPSGYTKNSVFSCGNNQDCCFGAKES